MIPILLRLFWEFFKTGLFAVGGGLATLPFLERISDATGWYTRAQLIDMIAVSEATPGPIGINMATFAGYLAAGVPGAVAATLGEVAPSLVLVLLAARFLQRFEGSRAVKAIFYGIRPASMALIAAAGWGVLRVTLLTDAAWPTAPFAAWFRWKSVLLAAPLAFLVFFKKWKVHPVAAIGIAAAAGVLFKL